MNYGATYYGRSSASSPGMGLARGMGYFSLALGLTEVLAPRALAHALGMPGAAGVLRAYGVREMATGVAILASHDPRPWIWGRVGGDALDLATLAPGLDQRNDRRGNVLLAMAAVAGATVLDLLTASALHAEMGRPGRAVRDYSDRSGLPRSPVEMRGAASNFETPRDMRAPEAMRPYVDGKPRVIEHREPAPTA